MTEDQPLLPDTIVDSPLPAVVEPAALPAIVDSPLAIIANAVQSGGLDVDVLGGLMSLVERREDREAEMAYNEAMAAFQRDCPSVVKSRTAGDGKWQYQYAGLDDVMRGIKPTLTANGFSLSFSSCEHESGITVTCTIAHVAGHAKTAEYTSPIPKMSVNETQKMGAALSYAKRYCLVAALNLIVSGEDDDAAGLDNAHPNPTPDPNAPTAPTRGQRVSEDEIIALRDAFYEMRPEVEKLPAAKRKQVFFGWVETVALDGAPFPDTWTRAIYTKCREAL